MNKDEAMKRMKAPNDSRGNLYGVFQILVTTRCDLGTCSNCTQRIPYRKKHDMELFNFDIALQALEGYEGVVGIMGGNPCLHPVFTELCLSLEQYGPYKKQCGLWTNNIVKDEYAPWIRSSFGYFNVNVHCNPLWAEKIRKHLPTVKIWGLDKPSMHSAVLVDMSDLVHSEEDRWDLISNCDVNQRWSPAMAETRDGVLRGYFCEIMAGMDDLRDGDYLGIPVKGNEDWWKEPVEYFEDQIQGMCHHCGIPLRIKALPDNIKTDDVSKSTVAMAESKKRKHCCHVCINGEVCKEVTDYQKLRSK